MKQPIIINYKNTDSLFDLNLIPYSGPIITAVQAMAKAYHKASDVLQPVTEINIVIQRLLEQWKSPELKLDQSLLLGEIIDTLIEQSPDEQCLQSMRKNKSDILQSILTLVEIGIRANILPERSIEEHRFKYIYNEFCQTSASGVLSVESEWNTWNNPEIFKEKLAKALGASYMHALYFQGFYYITPLQGRIIDAACNLNIPVYYLNNYDEQQPEIFQIWHDNPRFKNLSKYKIPDTALAKNQLSFYLTDQKQSIPVSSPKILEFKDNFSFIKNIILNKNEEMAFYAPTSKDIKNLFDAFFPAQEEKRHLLSYPIGKYLLTIYKMWDSQKKQLIFQPEQLRLCISTGWAGKTYSDCSALLSSYDKLALFFEDCKTIVEWRDRANYLRDIYSNILSIFPASNNCWKNMMNQPLKLYSPFSIDLTELEQVLSTLESIAEDAELIFKGRSKINLVEHFSALDDLLRRKENGAVILKKEQDIVHGLLHKLKNRQSNIKSCSASQLSEAMNFFLNGTLNYEDENLWHTDAVRGLSDIEATPFLHPGKKIMLCYCDAEHLPGKPKQYSWPLSKEYFKHLGKVCNSTATRIEDYKYYMKSTRLSNRYLFALSMKLPELTASWISEHQGKFLTISPYLMVLVNKYKLKIVKSDDNMLPITKTNTESKIMTFRLPVLNDTMFPYNKYPAEVAWNTDWCPLSSWRNLYDFILSPKIYYQDRFHLDFYLTALTAVLHKLTNRNISEIAQFIFNIIPTINQAEQSEIISFAERAPNIEPWQTDKQDFCGEIYQVARLYLKYLPLNKAYNYIKNAGIPYDNKHKTDACIYCPHCNYCQGKVILYE